MTYRMDFFKVVFKYFVLLFLLIYLDLDIFILNPCQ